MRNLEISELMLTDELRVRLFSRCVEVESGCIEWRGAATNLGYGRIKIDGKAYLPHRLAYAFANAGLSGDGVIDHLCRNPRCVNIEHLDLVSRAENNARGTSPLAAASRASIIGTHCGAGHLRTPDTWKLMSGSFKCVTCRKIAETAYRASARGRALRARDMRAYRARKKVT